MVTLTPATFQRIKDKFFAQLNALPVEVTIIVETLAPVADDQYQAFLGARKETFTSVRCKCLYQRDISISDRKKYGLKDDITSFIYIAPQELINKFGTFKVDRTKLIFRFTDYEANAFYEVDKIEYMEPLYDSCIAVMFHLKSTTKQIDVNTLTEAEKIIL